MKQRRFYYGWIMVILAMVVLYAHAIMIYTFGVFLRPLTIEFGWERGALSAAQSITMLIGGGLAIYTGNLSDKIGPKPLVTLYAVLAATVYFLMSRINTLWQVYAVWGILMGIAFSLCFIPVTSAIPRWFDKSRGLAMGLTVSGTSLSGMISPPLAQWLISTYSWRTAYVVLGFITLILVIPASQFMKNHPQQDQSLSLKRENISAETQHSKEVSKGLSLAQAAKTGRFWIFCLVQFCFTYFIQTIVVHIAPHAVDIGVLAMVAAGIISVIAGSNLLGKLTMGFVVDRTGARRMLSICLGMFSLTLIWLLFAKESWMLYIFALFFGIAYGTEISVFTLIPAELFGLRHLGTIAGMILFLGTIGGAIGSPLAGYIFDATGSYQLAFLISLALCFVSFMLSLTLLRSKKYE